MEDLMRRLEHRIKIVRTARIEAAKRFKAENEFYRTITIVYSIIITSLSIWFVIGKGGINTEELSPALLTLATFVTLFTMYTSIKNPGEKVGRFQSNYMELTRLLSEIQSYIKLIDSNSIPPDVYTIRKFPYLAESNLIQLTIREEYAKFSKRYASLLTQSDNHDPIDYWLAVKQEKNKKTSTEKLLEADKFIRRYKKVNYFKKVIASISLILIFLFFLLLETLFGLVFSQ